MDRARLDAVTGFSPYDNRPFAQFWRIVTRTFRIGTAFGVEVRMYWAAAILMPLLMLSWTTPYTDGGLSAFVLVAIQFVLLFTVIWTHEMGHITMGRRYGIPSSLITLSPLGGLAHLGHAAPTPGTEVRIALAGPAVHLIWLLVFAPLAWWLPYGLVTLPDGADPLWFTAQLGFYTNLSLMLFNLLPIFPLDGGRTARGLLALRWHPNRVTLWVTTAGMIGGGILVIVGLASVAVASTIMIVIGISCIFGSLHERRLARHALIYQGVQRHPWESDPDAWQRGGTPTEPQPGPLGRWLARRAERKAQRLAAEDRELSQQVDEVLERLQKVGMTGLSKGDKAILQRASKRHRGAG